LIGPDNKRLVEIWNSLTGVKPVTKFANRKVATERIWKAIQGLGEAPATELQGGAIEVETAVAEVPAGEPSPELAQTEPPLQNAAPQATAEPVATVDALGPEVAPAAEELTNGATPAKKAPKAKKAAKPAKAESGPREGSKTAQVVAMLKRDGGATLSEIMQTMGWQKHTVRGFMAGAMKKAGYTVESFKPEGGERTYRINQ
jgi:Protein of unknown function (DUF3489)